MLVLGAGGAARAGMKAKGAEVTIVNRTPAKAMTGRQNGEAQRTAKLSFDLIVNATPLGMGPAAKTPLEENEPEHAVGTRLGVQPEWPLLKLAQSKGLRDDQRRGMCTQAAPAV